MSSKVKRAPVNRDDVLGFLDEIFEQDVHAKRILSMANATTGVLTSGSLAVSAIGQGMAFACGLAHKHSLKQVDRLLGNERVKVWDYFAQWVPFVVAERQEILVAFDWTDFDRDGHATIAANLMTDHGRAIPLVWRTVNKSELKEKRNSYEDSVLERLKETVPPGVKVTVVADRGFMDTHLFEVMQESWGFDYIIRLRGNVIVTASNGERRAAEEWVGSAGKAKTLRNVKLTNRNFPVATVVCTKAKEMKEPWCLATSNPEAVPADLLKYYAKRWGIEAYFRDAKDLRFGMGMDAIHTKSTERRDRLFLLAAFAIVLLTLLGGACEAVGYDRYLKANTVKRRTHSLFRQGLMVYELMPTMKEEWLARIVAAFSDMLAKRPTISEVFSVT